MHRGIHVHRAQNYLFNQGYKTQNSASISTIYLLKWNQLPAKIYFKTLKAEVLVAEKCAQYYSILALAVWCNPLSKCELACVNFKPYMYSLKLLNVILFLCVLDEKAWSQTYLAQTNIWTKIHLDTLNSKNSSKLNVTHHLNGYSQLQGHAKIILKANHQESSY